MAVTDTLLPHAAPAVITTPTPSKTATRVSHLLLFVAAVLASFVYTSWSLKIRPFDYFLKAPTSHWLRKEQGLLVVGNAKDQRHPIPFLIARAEKHWQQKLDRQSTTLRQAYDEYIRRYGRKPPKGFDVFNWCKEHDVQLLDEYDQLDKDLKLFWATSPADLKLAQEELEHHKDTYTIGKEKADANITMLTHNMTPGRLTSAGKGRSKTHLSILEPFAQHLPPFRATWSLHDAAQKFVGWEMREAANAALAEGRYMDISALPQPKQGWAAACTPGTPLNPISPASIRPQNLKERSFIADHRASMDPCYTPELARLSTLGDYPDGIPPANKPFPALGRAKTMLHADILGTTIEGWTDEVDDTPWENKTIHELMWRGSTTGREFAMKWEDWQTGQRLRLVEFANTANGTVTLLPPPRDPTAEMEPLRTWDKKKANKYYFDMALIAVIQCRGAICSKIRKNYRMEGRMSLNDEKRHRFIFDADGNSWSSRFRRLMTRNSLIFKSTVYPEWWTDRAMPWVHFVPIKLDFSDLHDAIAFFRGLPDGTPGHDELGKKIAHSGKEWIAKYWRREDITAYTWRVYLEFIRVMSPDRTIMDFTLADDA